MKKIKSFFRDCEAEIMGSAGKLIYCENRGVELVFSFEGKYQGISIVTPGLVESMVDHSK